MRAAIRSTYTGSSPRKAFSTIISGKLIHSIIIRDAGRLGLRDLSDGHSGNHPFYELE